MTADLATPPTQRAAKRLKALREEAGLSLDTVAERMGMPTSTYRHYEDRAKREFLPQHIVAGLLEAFRDHPEMAERIRALGELPVTHSAGFQDEDRGYGARPAMHKTTAARILESLDAPPPAPEKDLKIGTDGRLVQVVATVDRDGLDRLIRRLEAMKSVLDD